MAQLIPARASRELTAQYLNVCWLLANSPTFGRLRYRLTHNGARALSHWLLRPGGAHKAQGQLNPIVCECSACIYPGVECAHAPAVTR